MPTLRKHNNVRDSCVRWGKPYESMEKAEVVHFETGETMATVHQANGGLVKMDMRKAKNARNILREHKISALIDMCAKAADIFENDTLPCGNGTQSPEDFCKLQSASTGLPENMCLFNMGKNAFALRHMGEILDALTRGLPLDIFTDGYGMEDRGVMVSYQANTNVRRVGPSFEQPRRSHVVATGHPSTNRTCSEAGFVRTMDAVPHLRSDGEGWHST